MINLPNPFESALAQVADTAAASSPAVPLCDAAAEPLPNLPQAQEDFQEAPAAVAASNSTHETAGATDYIPELFSSFVHRRCIDKVNPPLPQQCRREFVLDEAAFLDAILPPEPPPIFLRKPRPEFLRALFELAR